MEYNRCSKVGMNGVGGDTMEIQKDQKAMNKMAFITINNYSKCTLNLPIKRHRVAEWKKKIQLHATYKRLISDIRMHIDSKCHWIICCISYLKIGYLSISFSLCIIHIISLKILKDFCGMYDSLSFFSPFLLIPPSSKETSRQLESVTYYQEFLIHKSSYITVEWSFWPLHSLMSTESIYCRDKEKCSGKNLVWEFVIANF